MNNSNTPKIVIGVGLVALYAAGLAVFALRGKHDNLIAQSPPAAVSASMDDTPAPLPSVIPQSADTSAAAAMPAPIAPVTNAAEAPQATRPSVVSQPRPRAAEVPVASLPSPRPPASIAGEESSRNNSGSNAVIEAPAPADTVSSESETAVEGSPSDEDSQSTEAPALDSSDQ